MTTAVAPPASGIPIDAAAEAGQGPSLVQVGMDVGTESMSRPSHERNWRLDYMLFIEIVYLLGTNHFPLMTSGPKFMMEVNRGRVKHHILPNLDPAQQAEWEAARDEATANRRDRDWLEVQRDLLLRRLRAMPGHQFLHLDLILQWKIGT